MKDEEIIKTREKLKLYRLSQEEVKEEYEKFNKVDKKDSKKNSQQNPYGLNPGQIDYDHLKKNRKAINDTFNSSPFIKEIDIPHTSNMINSISRLKHLTNTLKIDLFAVNFKTKVKTTIDILRTLLCFFFRSIADYVNNQFSNTIHIDLISPISDIVIFSKDILKTNTDNKTSNLRIMYLYRILEVLSNIDISEVNKYLNALEFRIIKPFKYYEIAPVLQHLYKPLVILNEVYKNNEFRKCIKEFISEYPEKRKLADTLSEMFNDYFSIYKRIMYPVLLKDMGGIFYDFFDESGFIKKKLISYFNLTPDDFVEPSFKEFKAKFLYLKEKYEKEKKEAQKIKILDDYNKLPEDYDNFLNLLKEFFPDKYIEFHKSPKKTTEEDDKKMEIKFNISQLSNFTDIFRYFHCPTNNISYALDDKFLYFSKYHPLSQIIVFILMAIDLFSGLENINYLSDAKVTYAGESYACANFFKNILDDLSVLYKYTIAKIGDIIRDISLSYSDNKAYLRTSSFETYLDELTIYLKNNLLSNLVFNSTISGISYKDLKFSKYDVKKTLFIDNLPENIKKLKIGIDIICEKIDKRKHGSEQFISKHEQENNFRLGRTHNYRSAFEYGFKKVYVKTKFDGTKLITDDNRTVYNYLFFSQKFINLLYYILFSENSYILKYAQPTILRNQPERLLRIIDENTKNLIIECKSLNISQVMNENLDNTYVFNEDEINLENNNSITNENGLYTKKYFITQLLSTIKKSRNNNIDVCLMIIDIDDFKEIAKIAGNDFTDIILGKISTILKKIIRNNDLLTDYKDKLDENPFDRFDKYFNGDEFILLLKGTNIENANFAAQKILKEINGKISYLVNKSYKKYLDEALNKNKISIDNFTEMIKNSFNIHASIGISQLTANTTDDDFFKIAVESLAASKSFGKNCYTLFIPGQGLKTYNLVDNKWIENIPGKNN